MCVGCRHKYPSFLLYLYFVPHTALLAIVSQNLLSYKRYPGKISVIFSHTFPPAHILWQYKIFHFPGGFLMSDLTATNCGCGCDNGNNSCCNTLIWLLLLTSCCGNGNGFLGGNGCGNDSSWLWLILILCCCGGCGNGLLGNNGCGCGNGCGC